jgi:anaerobic selenocysteine-containing dehydrogenase
MENPKYSSSQPDRPESQHIPLEKAPPPHRWGDWVEYESGVWPRKREKHYTVVPTTCCNCESACGLLAFVDKESGTVARMEGNPHHPASRGRICAMGPATVNQINDPERILHPLKRIGRRGEGKWERISWEQALREISTEIRALLLGGRRNEILYHACGSIQDGVMERVLQSWGIAGCGHQTNRGSPSVWFGCDRVSPDFANARFILLLGTQLESGGYYNPHAQRIIEARMQGAKIAVMNARLSSATSKADYWLAPYPGTEAAVLLAMAHVLMEEDLFDADFVRRWTNWRQFMFEEKEAPDAGFEAFLGCLREIYSGYTPEFACRESGIPALSIVQIAREIGYAGPAFASHFAESSAGGNLGGWQVTRCLEFLNVLTGSVGTPGGVSPAGWNKFVPAPLARPGGHSGGNEPSYPRENPLARNESSLLLPYFLKEGLGRLGAYFTRAFNPVGSDPDGISWVEVLRDERKIGLHVALTPAWNETALLADYILPTGFGGEQHGIQSRETHAGLWVGFGQPVIRVAREMAGESFEFTDQANPGEVREEDEFWIKLSWKLDADGSLGIRPYFESPYRAGERITAAEHYRWIFENSVPGLPEKAMREGLSPLEFMRKYGAVEIPGNVYNLQETPLRPEQTEGSRLDELEGVVVERGGKASTIGILVDGRPVAGFPTSSRRLEFFSKALKDGGWCEYALPGYIPSHVDWKKLDRGKGEFVLIPIFDLQTTLPRWSGNAKWLAELSHSNPLWVHYQDAGNIGLNTGDLVRVVTEVGYFVARVWATEAVRPGVVACSRPAGRWSFHEAQGTDRWCSVPASLEESAPGIWHFRQQECIKPFASEDPDSARIWWTDAGIHSNLASAPHSDPVSGMHCGHQRVRLEPASAGDRHGDVCVDTGKTMAVVREWLGRKCRKNPADPKR